MKLSLGWGGRPALPVWGSWVTPESPETARGEPQRQPGMREKGRRRAGEGQRLVLQSCPVLGSDLAQATWLLVRGSCDVALPRGTGSPAASRLPPGAARVLLCLQSPPAAFLPPALPTPCPSSTGKGFPAWRVMAAGTGLPEGLAPAVTPSRVLGGSGAMGPLRLRAAHGLTHSPP